MTPLYQLVLAGVGLTFVILACLFFSHKLCVCYTKRLELRKSNDLELAKQSVVNVNVTSPMHARRASETVMANFDGHALIEADELEMMEVIGKGASGVVKLGVYSGSQVAIKQITVECDAALVKEVENEAQILSKLRHPNIVQFFGLAHDGGHVLMLVMEHCPLSLRDFMYEQQNEVSEVQQLQFLLGIAAGMRYLHRNDVIHRDLKLGNILLSEDLNAKVTDFGGSARINDATDDTSLTANVGTPAYMAPELTVDTKKARYSDKVDVYSFAVVIWACVTRKRPFDNPEYENLNVFGLVNKIVEGARPKVTEEDFGVNYVDLKDLMISCWDGDPVKRPSFEEIEKSLQLIARSSQTVAEATSTFKIQI